VVKEIISRNLKKLEKKEQKILGRKDGIIDKRLSPIVGKIESKMPDMMRNTLDAAFYKSFELVFQNGTKYIEKLYNKEKIKSNHSLNDYKLSMEVDRKSIKELDRHARNSKILNSSISAVEGAGLGFIGMGLPDIPLFTAMILKTIYEISLSYGYEYELDSEKVYILNLICAALTRGESQIKHNARVDEISRKIDSGIHAEYDMKREISAWNMKPLFQKRHV
jgi:hypothetical protein